MASRSITITVAIDLARKSKEAYGVSINRLSEDIGGYAVTLFEENGYSVQTAKVNTLIHYVRHNTTKILRRARKMKIVKSA